MERVTDTIMYRLRELRLRVANLITAKRFTEMGDDRAYSNGRMAEYDRDIAQAKTELASYYRNSPLEITTGDMKLTAHSDDGFRFSLIVHDFTRPGVLKKVEFTVDDSQRASLAEYLGGRTVNYLGEETQPAIAFESLDRRTKEMVEELGRLRREAREKDETIRTLNGELEARFNDGNR